MNWPMPETMPEIATWALLVIVIGSLLLCGGMLFTFLRAAWKADAKSKRGFRIVGKDE